MSGKDRLTGETSRGSGSARRGSLARRGDGWGIPTYLDYISTPTQAEAGGAGAHRNVIDASRCEVEKMVGMTV